MSTTSVVGAGLVAQGVVGLDGRLALVVVGADAVEEEVHRAEAADAVDQLDAAEGVVAQVLLLVPVEVVVARRGIVRRRAGSRRCRRRGRTMTSPGCGLDAVDDGVDERPGREVLPGAALDVLGVLLQQPLVGVALHVGGHRRASSPCRSARR